MILRQFRPIHIPAFSYPEMCSNAILVHFPLVLEMVLQNLFGGFFMIAETFTTVFQNVSVMCFLPMFWVHSSYIFVYHILSCLKQCPNRFVIHLACTGEVIYSYLPSFDANTTILISAVAAK